jgi:hypothetical protein
MSETTGHSGLEHPSGYEKKDTNVRKLTLYAFLTVIFVAVSAVVLNEYFVLTREGLYYEQVLQPISEEYTQLQAREDSLLTSYELIDTAGQFYRIPIDSAMKLTLQEASTR